MMDQNYYPKLGDFGLSKKINQNPENGSIETRYVLKGTVNYMAPEIMNEYNYSKASDVYAFGMIVYEIITGQIPFEKDSFLEIIKKVPNGDRPTFNSPIEKPYRDLIEKCWSQNPEDRPTIDQIISELLSPDFITPTIEEQEYIKYIEYINNYSIVFDPKKRIDFTKNYLPPCQMEPDMENIAKKDTTSLLSRVFNLFKKEKKPKNFFPNDLYLTLDKANQELVTEAMTDESKQFLLGKFLIEGKHNFQKNLNIGIEYLNESMSSGCIDSVVYISQMLIDGVEIPKDIDKAKKYLVKHLRSKDSRVFYLYGKILKKQGHKIEARMYFEESSKSGNNDSMYEYGKMLFIGRGGKKDSQNGFKYLSISQRNGNTKSDKFITLFEQMKMNIDGFENLPSETQYIVIKNTIKSKNHHVFTLNIEQAQIIYDNHSFESTNFCSVLRTFSELYVDVKYPSKSFDSIINIIQNINNHKITKVRTHLFISGVKELSYKFGQNINNGIHEVTIESSVQIIKDHVFSKCNDLVKVTILSPLVLIGDNVFYGCTSLSQITFPPTLKEFGINSFFKCISLTDISAPMAIIDIFYTYGNMLSEGINVSKNEEEACLYYKIAANKDQINAMNNYAFMLKNGRGIKKNEEEACRYLKKAADRGNITAIYNYGTMLESGVGVPKNEKEAYNYFQLAADQGQVDAMYKTGCIFESGIVIPKNEQKASYYYKKAADGGNIDAMYKCGKVLQKSQDASKKRNEYQYFEAAAKKGHVDSMYEYGYMLESGIINQKNDQKASYYYKKAADKGNINALYRYALILAKSTDLSVICKAYEYLKTAADQGQYDAMYEYGSILEKGEGVEVNAAEASRYYQMAIEKGNTNAMNCYGLMLKKGSVIPKNEIKACNYFKMAADQGHPDAMYNYGMMLKYGTGVRKDSKKSSQYFEMAAERGQPDAMYIYGCIL